MQNTDSPASYGTALEIAAGAAFTPTALSSLNKAEGAQGITLMLSNPGVNVAQFLITDGNNVPATAGHPLAAGATLQLKGISPTQVLHVKSAAGTTVLAQAGRHLVA